MALKIIWSKRAENKFHKITIHLSEKWGKNSARIFAKKTFDFIQILEEFPEIGTIEFLKKEIRGFPITKQTTIFYRIENNRIVLINFFDNRQNPNSK